MPTVTCGMMRRWAFIAGLVMPTLMVMCAFAAGPAMAKKDGTEVRNESGPSGRGPGSDDRQAGSGSEDRDGGSSGSGSGSGHGSNSGKGNSNSGSGRGGALDEVSARVDISAGAPREGSGQNLPRVHFREHDRL